MTMHVIIFSKQKKDQNRKRKLEKEEITTPTAPNPVQKEIFRQRMYYVPKLVMNPKTKKIEVRPEKDGGHRNRQIRSDLFSNLKN